MEYKLRDIHNADNKINEAQRKKSEENVKWNNKSDH